MKQNKHNISIQITIEKLKDNYLISASMIYIICSFLLKGISFLVTPIFTRIMDAEDFGITSAFSTWVTFLSIIICCQVSGTVAAARVHRKKEEFELYMGNIAVLGLLSSGIWGVIILLFADILSQFMGIEIKLIPHLLIQSYGAALSALYIAYLIQTKNPKKNLNFTIIRTLIIIFGGLLLVLYCNDKKYMGKIWASTIVEVVTIIYLLIFFLKKVKVMKDQMIRDWKYALTLSIPLIFHLIANTLLGQSDRVFIIHMIGDSDAGIYTVAYSIGVIGMIFADACNNAWSPWYLENTKLKNIEEINKMAKLYILIITTCFVEIFLISSEIFEFMAPEPYWKAKKTVLFIILGVFFQFLYRFPQGYEVYRQNMKWTAICTSITAILNCILNYLLIPIWGIDGAAIATLISYILLFVMHECIVRFKIGQYNISYKLYIIPIIICSITFLISYKLQAYSGIRIGIAIIILILLLSKIYKKYKRILRQ